MALKIVFTGGPCAGKTTVISMMEKELKENGYKVFVVSESATELINGGITPHKDGLGMYNFQKLILNYQYQKEEIYNNALAILDSSNVVVIYDRGILDNKAYITDLEFSEILMDFSIRNGVEMSEEKILSRYDMVIHLETSALKEGYSLDSNRARYEDPSEAILLDRRTKECWNGHSNFHVVKSASDFSDKISCVRNLVYSCLDNKRGYVRKRCK